jgi:hypothetical protein
MLFVPANFQPAVTLTLLQQCSIPRHILKETEAEEDKIATQSTPENKLQEQTVFGPAPKCFFHFFTF